MPYIKRDESGDVVGVSRHKSNGHNEYSEVWPDLAPIVPRSASKLRLYEELRDAGKWVQIKAALDADEDAMNTWNFATIIDRSHPLIESLKMSLSWTDEEIDNVFIAAQ